MVITEKPIQILPNPNLPTGFQEVRKEGTRLKLTTAEIPWLPKDEEIELALITMNDTNRSKLYLGSAVRGKNITAATNSLDKHQSEIANNILYSHLPDIAQSGIIRFANRLVNSITDRPVMYLGNKSGLRIYFMQFGNIQSMPVVIKIASCDKQSQPNVLNVLTSQPYKNAKRYT